jgi:hypothetical protein
MIARSGVVSSQIMVSWKTVWSGLGTFSLNDTVTTSTIPAGAIIRITYRNTINGVESFEVATGDTGYVSYENATYVDEATDVIEVGFYGWTKQTTTQLKVAEYQNRGNQPDAPTVITKIEAYF